MPFKSIKEAVTDERDQQDISLLLIPACVISVILLGVGNLLIAKTAVDLSQLGTALGTILGLGGVGYGVKRVGEKYGSDASV